MATKDTDEVKKKAEEAVVVEKPAEQLRGQSQKKAEVQPTAADQKVTKKKQAFYTIAIVSGVILFFVGFGLGYLLGHNTASSSRSFPDSGTMQPPSDGGGRRFTPSSGTDNNTDDNSSSSSSSTPQTQTN